MSSEQLIVASYDDAVDASNSLSALEAAHVGNKMLSLVRRISATEMIGFCKSDGRIASWGKPDQLWDRHTQAGYFLLPDSRILFVIGPLVRAIMESPEWLAAKHAGANPLLTGLAALGIPEGHLREYANVSATGNSLVIVRGDNENIARIHEVLQTTRPAWVQTHSLRVTERPANGRTARPNRPVPLTRSIMPVNRRILFPVDFSQRSKELVPYVATVARKFNSEVTLFSVLGLYEGLPSEPEMMAADWPHYQDQRREQREGDLMELAAAMPDDVNVTAVVDSGEPAERIIDYAAKHDAGLIMMATHGRGTFRKLLLGSVTSKILHDSAYPVWTTAHAETWAASPKPDIEKIVCALDPESDGRCMLEAAADMASVYGAEVIIVHAVPVQTASLEAGLDIGFNRCLSDAAKDSIAELQRAAGTKWNVYIGTGNVATVVRDSALRNRADLVIVGRGCLAEKFGALRTHVGAIIRESPCPVLSVANDRKVHGGERIAAPDTEACLQ